LQGKTQIKCLKLPKQIGMHGKYSCRNFIFCIKILSLVSLVDREQLFILRRCI